MKYHEVASPAQLDLGTERCCRWKKTLKWWKQHCSVPFSNGQPTTLGLKSTHHLMAKRGRNHFLLAQKRPQKPIQDRVEWLLFPGVPTCRSNSVACCYNIYLVAAFNHLETYEFVNGKDYPIYSGKNVWNHKPVYITHDVVNITHQLPCEKHKFLWR